LNPADQGSRRLHFELHGDPAGVMAGVESIEAFLHDAGCSAASVQQMAVVAEEILTNIVRDAWPEGEAGHCAVDVTADAGHDGVHVSLRTDDDGVAFDPLQAEAPDIEASLDERSIGGLGILLIRSMTDTQVYQRTGGHNIFEVCKICPLARADC
jgi:anti-sigma regulatory factor (Ser/Thr protein kinase)